MAPKYVAPGPIVFNRNAGMGGGGGGFTGYYQAHDTTGDQQNKLDAIGLEGRIQGDLSSQRFYQASQLAQQSAELDAWQYQQRVTENEQLQLRQDQNSIAAIDADPTMTPNEKVQAKTRIKSRVDWVSERQKRDLQQSQITMFKAHADQYEAQAELDRRKTVFDAQNMTGMSKVDIDENSLPELKQYMVDAHPDLQPNSPEYLQKLQGRALEIGAGRKYVIDPKTGGKIADPYELERMKHKWSAEASVASSRSGTEGKVGYTEEDAKAAMHIVDRANEGARKAKQADPNIDEEAEYKKLYARYKGELDNISPAKKQEAVQTAHEQAVSGLDERMRQLKGNNNPEAKGMADLLTRMKDLTQKYSGTTKPRPPAIQAQLNLLKSRYETLEQFSAARANQGSQPAPEQPAAAPPQPVDRLTGSPFQSVRDKIIPGIGQGIADIFASIGAHPGG